MGKHTGTRRKKKRRPGAVTTQRVKDGRERLSVAELLTAAQEEMDSFQYEEAQTLCRIALEKEPDNVAALETSASLCLEVGNLDGARHCLGRAITLEAESSHEKYMSMAQLMEGREALQCYQKGIEILTKKILTLPGKENDAKVTTEKVQEVDMDATDEDTNKEGSAKISKGEMPTDIDKIISPSEPKAGGSERSKSKSLNDERAALVRQVSTAYCSIAELFMTDLCDEDEAEEQCQASITKAIEVDSVNPEAYQHMASFLLVKQEVEEAKRYMVKSLEAWLPQYRAVREGKADAGTFDPVEVCPLSYTTRLSTTRILIEVGDHKSALEVLEGLLEENDEVVDTWYLMGWNHYVQGEDQRDAAHYCLHRALQVHSTTPCEDGQLVDHLKELMEELGPYTEKEEPEQEVEDDLEQDSEEDEEEGTNDAMDTS